MSIFSKVPIHRPKRNTFHMPHEHKLSCRMGRLVPIFVADLVPGDFFKNTAEIFLRFAPMIAPIMHRVNVYTHFFFVPNRLVMPDWTDFITGNEPSVAIPFADLGQYENIVVNPEKINIMGNGSLADYLGLPTPYDYDKSVILGVRQKMEVSLLPFLAYQLIYNEYYRDQNLQEPIDIDYKNWTSTDHDKKMLKVLELRKRNWEKDYFTSCLPWAQKGEPVNIPVTGAVGGLAPVVYNPPDDGPFGIGDGHTMLQGRSIFPIENKDVELGSGAFNFLGSVEPGFNGYDRSQTRLGTVNRTPFGDQQVGPIDIDPNGNLWADLDKRADVNRIAQDIVNGGVGGTINDLRTAYAIQKWLERNARAGTRYIEQILAHFGVKTPDSRLQRPEYIGGGRSPVVISEVLQTSESAGTPQATMAGHGISAAANNSFKYKALEHGYIIGLMSVMPRTAYQQGIPRHFLRDSKFKFYWPSFANLGEQAVENQELFHEAGLYDSINHPGFIDAMNKATFGYQSRYAEYKYMPSLVHGDFREKQSFWHMGRKFKRNFNQPGEDSYFVAPKLNSDFITADPTERIFAYYDENEEKAPVDTLWCDIYNTCTAVRPMPKFSVPGFSDHI